MKGKYIVFLGNFDVDYTSETHYMKTLRKMGHVVMPLQEGKTNSAQIVQRAIKADMFFWVHTHGWKTEDIAEVIDILKEKNIPTVGYHLDLWLGIQREKDLANDPYWNIEHFFTVDKLMADLMNSREDLPKAYYLPAGVYSEECYMAEFEPKYAHDVIFVGSSVYHPEWKYRSELIAWLQKRYGQRFAHYGRGGKGIIRGAELNKLYASSKIVIGDTLCKDFKYPYYLSDRIFETTGRGGFIIHPYIDGIKRLYNIQDEPDAGGVYNTSKSEIITYKYGDFEYLAYLIDYFIANEDERLAIRDRGHERTKKDHTYTNRMQFILNTVFNES